MKRVGGANDGGVDLIGNWKINEATLLVQCKHISKKLQPATVREFEGVLAAYQPREHTKTASSPSNVNAAIFLIFSIETECFASQVAEEEKITT